MKMLQASGVTVAIITGRSSKVVDYRMESLGIKHVYQGQQDKRHAFFELLDKMQLTPQQVAYVGDDVVDLPVMSKVGLAIAVQDAHPMVLKHAHWQTPHCGGRGAGRDVCEMLMEAHGVLQATLDSYLQ
jgi:3-deoxy-D-manno-octulosonate 8-phosphate phosphatase (KDO 8-P phosphatase)